MQELRYGPKEHGKQGVLVGNYHSRPVTGRLRQKCVKILGKWREVCENTAKFYILIFYFL